MARQCLVLSPRGVGRVLALQKRLAFRVGFVPVGRDVELADHGHVRRRWLARLGQLLPVHGELSGHCSHGRVGVDQPGVAPPRSAAYCGVGVGRHPDRRVRLLYRARGGPCLRHLAIPAVVLDLVLGKQQLGSLQNLSHAAHSVLGRHTKGRILLVAVAQTDAENKPPVADGVHCGQVLGQRDGIVQRQQQNGSGHLHVAGLSRHTRQERQRGRHLVWRGEVMLATAYEVESGLPRRPHLLGAVCYLLRQGVFTGALRVEKESYFHCESLPMAKSGFRNPTPLIQTRPR